MTSAVDGSWMLHAGELPCTQVDPEVFFSKGGRNIAQAKAICARCPSREDCCEYAVHFHEVGVWGQTTTVERAAIRRRATIPQPRSAS